MLITVSVGSVVTFSLFLTKDGNGVSGQVPTLELRRISDGWYFDWSATQPPYWKTAGGQRLTVLGERPYAPGLYTKTWDHGQYSNQKEMIFAIYRNAHPDYWVYSIEQWSFDFAVKEQLTELKKYLTNKTVLRRISDTEYEQEFYDDDKQTIIRKDRIYIIGDEEIREPQ